MSSRFQFCLVAVVLGMVAGDTVAQQKSAAQRTPTGGRAMAGARQKGGPGLASRTRTDLNTQLDVARMAWGPEEALAAERQDVMAIAAHMYGLQPEQIAELEKPIVQVLDDRWHSDGDGESKINSMVQRRAHLFMKLTGGNQAGGDEADIHKQLMESSEFAEVNNMIRRYESSHPLNFSSFVPLIEQALPQEQVQAARENWAMSATSLPLEVVQNRTLAAQVSAGSYQEMLVATSESHPWIARKPDHEKLMKMRAAQMAGEAAPLEPVPIKVDPAAQPAAVQPRPAALGQVPVAKPANPPAVRPVPAAKAVTPNARPTPPPVSAARVPAVPPRPLSEWEKYVQEFITKYQLSETQKNAALAILRDMTARANQLKTANESRIKEAEAMKDPRAKSDKLKELNAPIDAMFVRLKARLDNLLTAAQIEQGNAAAKPKR